MKRLIATTLCVTGFFCGWTMQASAAALPGAALPGQIERQFKPEPRMRADVPERTVLPEIDQPMPANAKAVRFELSRIIIEGLTVYREDKLRTVYEKHLGREVSLSDIYQIAADLTAKYRNDGYILSQVIVPAQSVSAGEVRLKAIEGYISTVKIEGGKRDWRKLVDRYGEKIKGSRPLKVDILERYLLLMNDLPGAFAQAVIKPSKTEPGAADLTVHFTQRHVTGGVTVDNRGGETLGPARIFADLEFNSVLTLQESTGLRAVSSGNDRLFFASMYHEQNIGPAGGKLNLSGSITEGEPKDLLFIPLNLETSSKTAAISYMYPFIRSRSQNLSMHAGLTTHDGKTKIFGIQDTQDRVRAFRLGATYDRADALRGINLVDVEVSQGIDGLGSSENGDPRLSRLAGKVDFTKATVYAARLQSITSKFSILAAVNAQYAWSNLLSSELYSYGGEQFGRGYDPSELVGDHGVAAKLELRLTDSLPCSASFITFYTFYDIGVVYQRSLDSGKNSESAASTGFGIRFNLGRHVSAFGEFAKPLTRDVAVEGNRDARGYGGLSIRF